MRLPSKWRVLELAYNACVVVGLGCLMFTGFMTFIGSDRQMFRFLVVGTASALAACVLASVEVVVGLRRLSKSKEDAVAHNLALEGVVDRARIDLVEGITTSGLFRVWREKESGLICSLDSKGSVSAWTEEQARALHTRLGELLVG